MIQEKCNVIKFFSIQYSQHPSLFGSIVFSDAPFHGIHSCLVELEPVIS